MKLARLIELHRQDSNAASLNSNFGDGFLYKNNRIFRNIRKMAVEKGYAFTNEPDLDYASLPFSQLERILKTKKIPFSDNVSVLEGLARAHPNLQWEDLSDGLKKNYVFHESCHGVIRSTEVDISPEPAEVAFRMLFEESFANVCELLAVTDAQDDVHRNFYEVNSYTSLFADRSNLKQAMDQIGEQIVFRFLWLAYLHSNFLATPDEKSWQRTLSVAGATPASAKVLKAVARIAFTLDLGFRTKTTRLHLQLSGLTIPLEKLLSNDPISKLENDPQRQLLQTLTQKVLC